MAIRSSNKRSLEFSASSMSDLVFLLLIFFMITSTLISPNALKLLLPQSSNQVSARAITSISITRDLQFYIETRHVRFEDIEPMLVEKLVNEKDPTVSLHVDKSVPMEEVVRVMNIAKNNKWKLILATTAEPKQ